MRKKTTTTKKLLENHMVLVSSFIPASSIYTPLMVPQQGASQKTRRMRKRARAATEVHEYKKARLSTEQLYFLEQHFETEEKLDTKRKYKIASELGMNPRQVAVWFQNRRARMKTQNLEKKYSNLKTSFDKLKTEKCGIETELVEARKTATHFETVANRYKTVLKILLAMPRAPIIPVEIGPAMPNNPNMPVVPAVPSSPALPPLSSSIDDAFSACSPQSVLSVENDLYSPLFQEFGVDAYEDIFSDVSPADIMYCPCFELWEWDWLNYLNTL